MAKKRPPYNQNAAIRSAIRRTFSRSPVVREVMMEHRREIPKFNIDGSRAKKDAVQYQCGVCQTWTKSTAISVDHKDPVISVDDGFKDWNTFVDRLFCDKSNLQVICDPCHDKKTNEERFARTYKTEVEFLDVVFGPDCYAILPHDDIVKFAKKFTSKRLTKYPPDFQERILRLKTLLGIKSQKRKQKS